MSNYQIDQKDATQEYRLTHEKILTKFYNSLFLAYGLADEIHLESRTLNEMNRDVELIACDIRKLAKKEKLKRVPPSYTIPDGKTIILDGGYFNQFLQRSRKLKRLDENKLRTMFDVYSQFQVDHEFLHSYLILSGEAKKILETYGKERYRTKMESKTDRLQKKFTERRIELCDDQDTKKIWSFWLKII